ncbi:MAG: UDP-3-O-acyl-N-acetylglucosamine deacetylase [Myxococcales bacterium]|nr:UDP-3-O-acyl-N-acetylglucosamine deacetylase [Myxococcales bacterium]
MRLLPAPAGHGVVFVRTDLGPPLAIKALAENVVDTSLATTLPRACPQPPAGADGAAGFELPRGGPRRKARRGAAGLALPGPGRGARAERGLSAEPARFPLRPAKGACMRPR